MTSHNNEHHQHHRHDHDARHELFEDGPRRARGGPRGGGPRGGGRFGGPGSRGHGHGHGRRGGEEGFFGRGPRAARGDVRAAVLALLTEQPMHGYQIIRELAERTGGVWSPSPGSVYPTLQLLADEGLVASAEEGGKRVYSVTDAGRAVVAERGGRPAPWDEVAGEADSGAVDVRALAMQVVAASRQVVQAGTAKDLEHVKAILTDARRGIYRILADSAPEDDAGTADEGDTGSSEGDGAAGSTGDGGSAS